MAPYRSREPSLHLLIKSPYSAWNADLCWQRRWAEFISRMFFSIYSCRLLFIQDLGLFISSWADSGAWWSFHGKTCISIKSYVDVNLLFRCIVYDDFVRSTPLQIDSGLMTPTMKIRRDRVVSLYKEQIDNMYKGISWQRLVLLCLKDCVCVK